MIEAYRAWIEAGSSAEQASKATKELENTFESFTDRVRILEIKMNIILGILGIIITMIAGLYLTIFNLMSRLPR